MKLMFEHIISREFWRRIYPANRTPRNSMTQLSIAGCVASREDFEALAPDWTRDETMLRRFGGKTHCLVFDSATRSRTRQHASHVWSAKLPRGSFYKLSDHLYVSSPEFTFLQLASSADIRELIAYGNELCGRYAFDQSLPRGFRTRTSPLITTRQLATYLKGAQGCRGHKRATRALKYIVEGSASPMETAIEMLNCLPCQKLGGYALDKPTLNAPIALNARASRIAQRSICYADMCYPTIKLDIEYHGRLDHDNGKSFDSDRARVNGLIEMGYEVIEITYRQVSDLMRYEAIVQHIAHRLGKKLRRENLGYLDERVALRRIVLEWNRSGGMPSFLR